ncbi:hypothetical protein O9H85_28410 [Paenibacillus filicis]|uniref:Photosynthesis system II assembly factor Ycf48/Hcf136-like domain-containing protein n=1 Tax=Paenibacillus gyeongsangnamensis TaxID=3388067 RepID=A0ABT4QH98_9BACL|nr:hypothetical protein [Paenibacillus filicis]MCZ8516248.1 hypothetical protein [Paenibacillus filicis]
MIRKSIAVLAAIVCTAVTVTPSQPSLAQSTNVAVRTVIGSVLSTDIRAFVNGEAIRSMNIGGNTAIVVEDLRSYGFDVSWDPPERRVDIYPNPGKKIQPAYTSDVSGNHAQGNKIADVLATDIRTVALGKEIPSFNIGGKTAVFLQDLAPLLGRLEWNGETRTVSFTENKAAAADGRAAQSAEYPLQIEHMSSNRFSIQFEDDGMYFGDQRIGFGQDGRAMLSVERMADLLGYKTDKQGDGLYVHNDTCGFRIGPDLETAELYWFGGKDNETKLTFPAVKQGGELYMFEYDLKEMFGYTGNWDPVTRLLEIDYARYDVKDFGIPESVYSYWYGVKGLLFAPLTTDLPMLFVTAARSGTTFHGSSTMRSSEQKTPSGAPIYEFASAVPMDIGDNAVKVEYRVRQRILYSKTFIHSITPERMMPVINYGDLPFGFGDFSSITLDTPATGQVRTDNGKVEVGGAVIKALGKGLLAVIEKEDAAQWTDRETEQIPFDAGRFTASLPLNHGKGRYRITLRSDLSIPAPRRYDPYIDVARFYVDYRDRVSRIVGMDGNEGFGWNGGGKLLHTTNTGKSWDVIVPDGIGDKDRLIAADFSDPYKGFAFYLTEDKKLVASHRLYEGGWETAALPTTETWETSSDVTSYRAHFDFSPDYVMLTSSPSAGQMHKSLYRSDDRGRSWTRVGDLTAGIPGYPTGISFRKEKEGWIGTNAQGQEGFPFYRTQDGGRTWALQPIEVPAEFRKATATIYPPAFDQESDYHGIFIAELVQNGEKTYVPYETRDAGDTWTPLPHLKAIQGVPVLNFDRLNMGRAISSDGKTVYTMNSYNHEDWQAVTTDLPLKGASQFFLREDGFGWVLLDGFIKVTSDGGRSWSDPQ